MQLVQLFHNVYSLWLAHLKIVFPLCEYNALFSLFPFGCVDQMRAEFLKMGQSECVKEVVALLFMHDMFYKCSML